MFSATGGSGTYQWSFIGSSPDPGLQLASNGVLSGTSSLASDCPSGPGIWIGSGYPTLSFQVQVTDSGGQSSAKQFCIPSYYPTPQITSLSPSSVIVDGQQHAITINGTNFRSSAYVFVSGGGQVPTGFVSGSALTFTLSPTLNAAFSTGAGGPLLGEGSSTLWIVQPDSYTSNHVTFSVFDPVPTVSSVNAVLNNSSQPCTANTSCQLVINGAGLVFATTYTIVETNTALIRAANPNAPIPWNTVTTSAFSVSPPGTYTVKVTNPNQPGGGSASAVGTFTVSQ